MLNLLCFEFLECLPAVFTDMHATCEAVKGGTASDVQTSTCGCGDTLPSKCQLQSAFTYEPPPPGAPPAVDMPAGARGLNMDCSNWRDQVNEGKSKQLQSMIRCMQQDCAQSLEAITCDYVTPEAGGTANAGLCYTNPGQIFCKENPTSPDCKRVAKWMPVKNIPFRYVCAARELQSGWLRGRIVRRYPRCRLGM